MADTGKPTEDSPSFEIVVKPPYPEPINPELPGRWFVSTSPDGVKTGVVWTDDADGFNFLGADIGEVPEADEAGTFWADKRSAYGLRNLTATDAFDTAVQDEEARVGQPAEVQEGSLSKVNDASTALLAAAEAPVEESVTTLAFTVSDDGEVLELIQSDDEGVAVRENGDWTQLNLDDPQPTVDDQEWLEVTEDAIAFWDGVEDPEDLTRDDVVKFAVEPEPAAR